MNKEMPHIGDYVRETIQRKGKLLKDVADLIGMSRQAFGVKCEKPDWRMGEMIQLSRALKDPTFFDELFKNSLFKELFDQDQLLENSLTYGKGKEDEGSTFRIFIQADPDDFNPMEWDRMSKELKMFMDRLKK